MLAQHGCRSLVARHLSQCHGWAGHLARGNWPASKLLRWRDLAWYRTSQATHFSIPGSKRRPRTGARFVWEDQFETVYSVAWTSLASDRKAWSRSRDAWCLAAQTKLLGTTHERDIPRAPPRFSRELNMDLPDLPSTPAAVGPPVLCRPGGGVCFVPSRPKDYQLCMDCEPSPSSSSVTVRSSSAARWDWHRDEDTWNHGARQLETYCRSYNKR